MIFIFTKGQVVNLSDFEAIQCMSQLLCCSLKGVLHTTQTNAGASVSIKLYLQKQTVGQLDPWAGVWQSWICSINSKSFYSALLFIFLFSKKYEVHGLAYAPYLFLERRAWRVSNMMNGATVLPDILHSFLSVLDDVNIFMNGFCSKTLT